MICIRERAERMESSHPGKPNGGGCFFTEGKAFKRVAVYRRKTRVSGLSVLENF
jgi:hypothetical protein